MIPERGLVNEKSKSLWPVVDGYARLSQSLERTLETLGIEPRQVRRDLDLHEYVAAKYGTGKDRASSDEPEGKSQWKPDPIKERLRNRKRIRKNRVNVRLKRNAAKLREED